MDGQQSTSAPGSGTASRSAPVPASRSAPVPASGSGSGSGQGSGSGSGQGSGSGSGQGSGSGSGQGSGSGSGQGSGTARGPAPGTASRSARGPAPGTASRSARVPAPGSAPGPGPAPLTPEILTEELNSSNFIIAQSYLNNKIIRLPPHDRTKLLRSLELLNACDCWKDFIQSTTPGNTKNILFNTTVKKLFGDIPGSWERIKDRIVLEILEDNTYGEIKPISVCWIEAISQADIQRATRPIATENNPPVTKLPSDVILGAHDSGYNPLDMSKYLQLILTPGSYIDPAYRKKLGDKRVLGCFGQGKPITDSIFAKLGFNNSITNFNSVLHGDRNMTIMLTSTNIQLETQRGVSHNTIPDTNIVKFRGAQIDVLKDVDFFGGNPTKNEWFNVMNKTKQFSEVEVQSILYVLCKLLGDSLQVIYLFMIIYGLPERERNLYVNRICMFTTDNVVLARCRVLSVACCCQSHLKKEYENLGRTDYWCPNMSEERRKQVEKQMYLKRCEEENEKTIRSIENLLGENNRENIFLMNGQEYHINDRITAFLRKIIQDIGEKTDYAKGENTDDKTAEDYHTICIESTALKLVDCFKVLTSAKSVFIKKGGDIIRDTRNTFGQHLYSLTTKEGKSKQRQVRHPRQRGPDPVYNSTHAQRVLRQQGGGNRGIPEKDFMQEFYDIVLNIIRRGYDKSLISQINHGGQPFNHKYAGIDYILINGDDIEEFYEDIAYDFLCHMSIFLNYVRYSCLDVNVLSTLLMEYMKGNTDYIGDNPKISPLINFYQFFFNIDKIKADHEYTYICKELIGNYIYDRGTPYKEVRRLLEVDYGPIVPFLVSDLYLDGRRNIYRKIYDPPPLTGKREIVYEYEYGDGYQEGRKLKRDGGSRKNYTNKRTQNSSKTKHHTKKRTHHSSKTKRKVKASMHSRRTHKK